MLARPGWPAVQTEMVEALTFRGCCQSPRADGQPGASPLPCVGNAAAGDAGSLREKSAWRRGGGGEGRPGETRGQEKKAGPAHNGAPVAAPPRTMRSPGTRGGLRQAGPRSSCLFRTRQCKCALLILNPLRRCPCEQGKGWPLGYFTIRRPGSPGAPENVCTTHANGSFAWREASGGIGRRALCPVDGEQNPQNQPANSVQ